VILIALFSLLPPVSNDALKFTPNHQCIDENLEKKMNWRWIDPNELHILKFQQFGYFLDRRLIPWSNQILLRSS
jgi:hypothetical protein